MEATVEGASGWVEAVWRPPPRFSTQPRREGADGPSPPPGAEAAPEETATATVSEGKRSPCVTWTGCRNRQ